MIRVAKRLWTAWMRWCLPSTEPATTWVARERARRERLVALLATICFVGYLLMMPTLLLGAGGGWLSLVATGGPSAACLIALWLNRHGWTPAATLVFLAPP